MDDLGNEYRERNEDAGGQMVATGVANSSSHTRSKVLQVRLSEREFEAIERAAKQRGSRASTEARERLLGMLEEDVAPVWTRNQRANALNVLNVVRASVVSRDAAVNIAAATEEVAKLVPGGASATDQAFAAVAPDIITGLINVAATLAEHAAQRSGLPVERVIADVTEAIQTVNVSD